ncbi:site-2 protease family protein [Paludibaculum fermentans]|uniref:site-2 protease family protein n=1 Tax=Paludibaculum fermentans TaxID=1473598 RepID=UPI003EB8CCAA
MAGLTPGSPATGGTLAWRRKLRQGNPMARSTVSVGRILGIPIQLDYSWFLIFGLLTWMLASNYYPKEFPHWSPAMYWVTAAATALLLFASVLLHELGHSFVALRSNIPVRSITLFIFGGVAQIGAEPITPKAEFLIAIAGPAVSLSLALLLTIVQPALVTIEPLLGLAKYLAYINFALAVFNLIPGFPLDGGRVFRSIIWAATKDMRRATLIAANSGRFFGYLFIFSGVWRALSGDLGGLWIAFIGWFLENAASAQVHQVTFQGLLAGHRVSQAMSTQCPSVAPELTLQQLVDEHVLGGGRRCFLVGHGEETLGLMTLHRIKEVPRSEWDTTTAAQVMLPIASLKSISAGTDLWAALQMLDRDGVNQLPVMAGNQVIGMLSRDDVITFLGTMQELGSTTPQLNPR